MLFMLVLCVLAPRLNSGRLAVVVVVKLQVIDVHCSVATVSGSTRGFPDCQFPHAFYTHLPDTSQLSSSVLVCFL